METIWAKPSPADLFGASPNALAFDRKGKTLYVANGTQNAVAVIQFEPRKANSALLGLIPVGWFPGAILVVDRDGSTSCASPTSKASSPRRRERTSGPAARASTPTSTTARCPSSPCPEEPSCRA